MRSNWKAAGAGMLLALCVPALSPAQEVLVGVPTLFSWQEPVDQPPVLKRKISPDVPKEMRQARDIGYVLMIVYLDAGGKNRHRLIDGTVHPYEVTVDEETEDWKVHPAQRGGKPVDTWFWLPVIFNPAGAAPTLAEATPRLLEVTPVFGPKKSDKRAPPSVVVPVTLTVNESGAAENIRVAAEYAAELQTMIPPALAAWKFAPARKSGQPIAMEIQLSVLVHTPFDPKITQSTPPKAVSMTQPVYPPFLINSGIRGQVTVEFVITREGKVVEPRVAESNNPGFNDAAVEAVSRWKFKPAEFGGKPIATKVKQLIVFEMDHGRDAFTVALPKKKNPATPEKHQADVAPKPRSATVPVYPYGLLRAGAKGSAEVKMIINDQGRVVEAAVVQATHPEFGHALVAAMEAFVFYPALKEGKPIPSALSWKYDFNLHESVSAATLDLLDDEKRSPEKIVTPAALDLALEATAQTGPAYPPEFERSDEPGEALVEFLIDREGRAALPRLVSASKPAFGYAAVQAVAGWRFAPPRAKGKPALVRVRIPISFALATK